MRKFGGWDERAVELKVALAYTCGFLNSARGKQSKTSTASKNLNRNFC